MTGTSREVCLEGEAMSDYAEVAPNVCVGGWSAARDYGSEFDVIINVAIDAPDFGGYHFNLVDGPGNKREEMQAAIACVEEHVKAGKRILIHCVAGRSRSVTVTAAALSRISGRTFDETLRLIAPLRGLTGQHPFWPHSALLELV
jgi:hypothetical protein